jgi:hypothetical protein
MRLLAIELLVVGAHILCWLVVLVLLLFTASAAQLGTLEFLAITSTWLVFFFGQVTVGIHAVRQFGVRGVGVPIHHRLEVGYQFGNQMPGSCAWCWCVLEYPHAVLALQLLENDLEQSRVVHVVVRVLLANDVHGQAKFAVVVGFGGRLDVGQQRKRELWDTNDDTICGLLCHVRLHQLHVDADLLAKVKVVINLELYIELVFSGWYWLVFLGIYHTNTKGNLGQYILVSLFWQEPVFPSKRGHRPPF